MSFSSSSSTSSTWQEKLQEKCRQVKINPPVYKTFSDRRGGRTAWSSRVTVSGQCIAARYWYDGQYLCNAKEDAAEMALKMFSQVQPAQAAVQPAQAAIQPAQAAVQLLQATIQPLPQGEDIRRNVTPPHRRAQSSMAGFNF